MIWDLTSPAQPTHSPPLKGSGSATQGEISFLSWNSKVPHILASTSHYGTTDGLEESADTSLDDVVQRALVVGDYKGAVEQCIAAKKKMADALVIDHVGGVSLWESTRNQYLKMNRSPYLKVVSAMVNNDLMNLVNARPLERNTGTPLYMAAGETLAATLCYICAGNIDKTVEIWSRCLAAEYDEKLYVDLLQDLMEKAIVLALATGQKQFSASLCKLVEKYAEILASQGLLTTPMEYLKLLGSDDLSPQLVILKDCIAHYAGPEKENKSAVFGNSHPASGPVFEPSHHLYPTHSFFSYGGYAPPATYQPQPPLSNLFVPTATPAPHVSPGDADLTYPLPLGSGSLASIPSQVGPWMSPMEPPSPPHSAPVQPAAAPTAPTPTVQAVDTSNVPAKQKPVITTLTRLFNETSQALGSSRANPAKKREIEDNSRKLGALFAKHNSGDISKLLLISSFSSARLWPIMISIQLSKFRFFLPLGTREWDECNFWLATLKRIIKTRRNSFSRTALPDLTPLCTPRSSYSTFIVNAGSDYKNHTFRITSTAISIICMLCSEDNLWNGH
ncbi:hypothetical protein V6N11_078052 [Hibiscus sabdariffa]|uniref:Ancestral coatomer element 1 Sec16/Sec31 domain-containing protein n=1 Tax=Hibiscus sabdariffa TaxID=183260 RepID=A0ABR2TEV7_9ROSI